MHHVPPTSHTSPHELSLTELMNRKYDWGFNGTQWKILNIAIFTYKLKAIFVMDIDEKLNTVELCIYQRVSLTRWYEAKFQTIPLRHLPLNVPPTKILTLLKNRQCKPWVCLPFLNPGYM